jgi:ribonuclease HII
MAKAKREYVPDAAVSIVDKSQKIKSTWYQALLESHEMSDGPITIGIDEVGVGSWYGPMVVVGVVNLTGWHMDGIKDSKQIKSEKVRQALASEIQHNCLWVAAWVHAPLIDKHTTYATLPIANEKIAAQLVETVRKQFVYPRPAMRVVMDGEGPCWSKDDVEYKSIPKADSLVFEVSAASIVAKVLCDNWIHDQCAADESLRRYDLDSNKGYGSPKHIAALKELGLTANHRSTYCGKYGPGQPQRRLK